MSAPDARWPSAMIALDGYLPVPTIRRERNDRPAMTRGSSNITLSYRLGLAAADEVDDLPRVPFVDRRGPQTRPLDDVEIVLHRHAPRLDVELGEQGGNAHRAGQLERVAVQADFQRL